MLTQLPRVPSLIPSSFATRAIGRDVSITILTASSLNSGEKLFFGRGNYFTFPDTHPNGWTVRKPRGTSHLTPHLAGEPIITMLLCLSRGSDGVLVATVLGLSGGVLTGLLLGYGQDRDGRP